MTTLDMLKAFLADPRFVIRSHNLDLWESFNRPRQMILRHRLICADGTTFSVQHGATHYCSGVDEPTSVEVWCCPHHPLLEPYGTGDYPYGYVPLEVLAQVLNSYGGIMPFDKQ